MVAMVLDAIVGWKDAPLSTPDIVGFPVKLHLALEMVLDVV